MKFSVLGTLKIITDDGARIYIAQPKKRALLFCMSLRASQLLPSAELLNAVWGEDQSERLLHTLHTHIWGIRRLDRQLSERIESHAAGYRLVASHDEVDALEFRRLARLGADLLQSGQLHEACAALEKALAPWPQTPFPDLPDAPALEGESLELLEEKYLTEENLADAQLGLGCNASAIPALMRLTNAQPLREHRWEQLMVALYRTGRRADSIKAYLAAREKLREEVGIEPGPRLRETYERILAGKTEHLNPSVPGQEADRRAIT